MKTFIGCLSRIYNYNDLKIKEKVGIWSWFTNYLTCKLEKNSSFFLIRDLYVLNNMLYVKY